MLIAGFALLRLAADLHAPALYPDSASYTALSFLGHEPRLWTVPLLYTLLPTDDLRVAGQLIAGVVAWSVLALSVGRLITDRRVQLVAIACVLVMGLAPPITLWDTSMLSESFSLSALVLLVALSLRLAARFSGLTATAAIAALGLWVFSRQTDAVAFLLLVILLAAFVVWRLPRRPAAAIVAVLVVIAAWSGYAIFVAENTAPANGVWRFNAVEVTVGEIAPYPDKVEYFRERGMPVGPVEESLTKGTIWLLGNTEFMRWVDAHFKRTYVGYLLKHFPDTIWGSLTQIAPNVGVYPTAYGPLRPVLPDSVTSLLWGPDEGDLLFWVVAAVVASAAALVSGRRLRAGWVLAAMLLTAAVMAIDTYRFAVGEYPRLFMPVDVLLRLALVMTVAFAADALLRPTGSPPRTAPSG